MYVDLDGHSPISQSGNGDNGPDKNYVEKIKNKVPVVSRVLKVGLQGYDVKVLQAELIKNGYKIQADGIYGSMTADAVRDYQKKHGLAVDGIAGDKTRTSLYCSSALAAAEANKVKKVKDTNEVDHSVGNSEAVNTANKETGNSGGGKVDDPNLTTALIGAATGYDTIAGGYVSGGASVTTRAIANNIYGSTISNSSSKVEAYRKMLDVANKADKFRAVSTELTETGTKSIGTKLGVAGVVVGGCIQIGSDVMNDNYSNTDKIKAVTVDTVQTGASIGAVVAASYYYDAFGNIVEETGTAQNPYRYSGYEYDKETKNYYLQSRYYNPKIARFLSEDSYRENKI